MTSREIKLFCWAFAPVTPWILAYILWLSWPAMPGMTLIVCYIGIVMNYLTLAITFKLLNQRYIFKYLLPIFVIILLSAIWPNLIIVIPDEETANFASAVTKNIILSNIISVVLFRLGVKLAFKKVTDRTARAPDRWS